MAAAWWRRLGKRVRARVSVRRQPTGGWQPAPPSADDLWPALRGDEHELPGQVRLVTPPGARLLVVGVDDQAPSLAERHLTPFPLTGADDPIARFEASRAAGAEYLLVPRECFPAWLDAPKLAAHVERVGSLVQFNDACRTYYLRSVTLRADDPQPPRVVALLATYNEERFIDGCLRNLVGHGIEVYLIDNASTDRTVEIARSWQGRGLIGIETLARDGSFALRPQLERKEQLALEIDADWFLHVDADEVHLSPRDAPSLSHALGAVAAAGWNAVNFQEFTFVPPRESPDHDHDDYETTLRWYYPFLPRSPWRVKAWRRQPTRVDLVTTGGHQARFPGMRLFPTAFPMKHYPYLSAAHAARKYARAYPHDELRDGVHGGFEGWRHLFSGTTIALPPRSELREHRSGEPLDSSNPRSEHYLERAVMRRHRAGRGAPRLAITGCLRDAEAMLPAFLAYHHALGVTRAYLYLDQCLDRTAAVIAEFPWAAAYQAPMIRGPHRLERVQCHCANEALARARADGMDWLLHIDVDEFAWGGGLDYTGSARRAGDLLAMLERARPETVVVSLRTVEAVPRRAMTDAPFWTNHAFVVGAPIERDVFDPSTGTVVRLARCLGHDQGKSAVRVAADVESANPHRWTTHQGVFPAEIRPLPEETLGHHFHYPVIDAGQWKAKFSRFADQPDQWARGMAQQFPKRGWKRVAASMSPVEAEDYFSAWVAVSEERLAEERGRGNVADLSHVAAVLEEIGFTPTDR